MLKHIKNRLPKRKKSNLKVTPGENVRDGIKTAEESGYAAGNRTEKLVEIGSNAGNFVDRGTELASGGETAGALGRIVFKTTKDISRGDSVCTGLCLVSGACETIYFGCSTVKIIPFWRKIYVGAKIISKGCMSYKNLCVGEGC